jgi:hypothetical protein
MQMYASYQTALTQAAATSLDPALTDFEINFAPVPPPPDNTWLDILLSVVDLIGTVAVSSFFNSSKFLVHPQLSSPMPCLCSSLKADVKLVLKTLPYFELNKAIYDTSKDTAKALVGFSTSIAGALTGNAGDG